MTSWVKTESVASVMTGVHVNCLRQKGAMSTKPVFEQITKIRRSLCFDTGTYYDY